MLSWEYPPVLVGGLGRHVSALSTALVAAGHEVTVVTRHAPGAPLEEHREGVRVLRAPEDPPTFPLATPTLLAWTMAFNHAVTRTGLRAAATGEYDLIHAHDWLVTHTAITLKEHLDLPLVATVHATEAGRHQGWLPDEMNKCIHSIERWLGHEACRVLVCSEYMRLEVTRLLDLPAGRVEVVPNGVDSGAWHAAPRAISAARSRFAGDGPHRPELQHEARKLKLYREISFAGFLGEAELAAVLAASDAVVVPSIYEPFGMVALEAAAAGAPLAVASTG